MNSPRVRSNVPARELKLRVGGFDARFALCRDRRVQVRLLAIPRRPRLAHLRLQILFVEFSQDLALGDRVPHIDQQRLDDPVGLGLHLDF